MTSKERLLPKLVLANLYELSPLVSKASHSFENPFYLNHNAIEKDVVKFKAAESGISIRSPEPSN